MLHKQDLAAYLFGDRIHAVHQKSEIFSLEAFLIESLSECELHMDCSFQEGERVVIEYLSSSNRSLLVWWKELVLLEILDAEGVTLLNCLSGFFFSCKQQCHNNTKEIPDATLLFVWKHPLMDKAVPAFGGQPIMIQASFRCVFACVCVCVYVCM